MIWKRCTTFAVVLLMLFVCSQPCVADMSMRMDFGADDDPSVRIMDGAPREVTYTKPNNYEHLLNWYLALEDDYPNYLRVWKANEDYGHGKIGNRSGPEGFDYWMVRLTNESLGLHKPEVLFAGTPHGDETPGPIGQYWFCDWILRYALTDEYDSEDDEWLRWILDNREIYLVVNHNPDGFNHYDSWQGRYDANGYDLNRQADYDHVPNSGTYNTGPSPWATPNGKTLRDFVQDHQIRVGADLHSGVRMLLYPWSSSHSSVEGTSEKTDKIYSYAPPDFHFYDISTLRLGSYMGSYGGTLDKDTIGTVPDTVGYAAPGGILSWAYGGDVQNHSAEDPHVQDETYGNYQGSSMLWISPEFSSPKNPSENEFGGDSTPGYAVDVRRFILHQTDLAQPYVWITKDSVQNNSVVNVGEDINFLWKVNGCVVVDDTYIQYGTSTDPVKEYTNTTPHRDMFKDKYWGGSGWEGAAGGTHMGYVHSQTVTAPREIGDYYFVIRAKVDQVFGNVTGSSTYGNDPYLRIIRERTDPDFTETLQTADGTETMEGRTWWYSDIVHIKVVKKPEILNMTPANNSEWVATDTNISVEFDLGMDHQVTENAFAVDPSVPGTFHWNGNNMTFDPDQELEPETTYRVTMGSSALSTLNTTLEKDVTFSFTTAYSSDIDPPRVLGSHPVDGAVDVPIDTEMLINFSEDMDPETTGQAFSTSPVIGGEISWRNGTSTLVFIPDKFLDGPKDYIFSISGAATDLGKNNLPGLRSFDFRTEVPDKVPPSINRTVPVDEEVMVPLSSNISIEFTEAMNTSYTEAAFSISPHVDGNLSWAEGNTLLIFDPATDLRDEIIYTVMVNSTAADVYFNTMEDMHRFSFTTEDVTAPGVIDNHPVDGATEIGVEISILINFSETMDPESLDGAIAMEPDVPFEITATGPTATLALIDPLEYETTYNITVSTDATDMHGLHLVSEHHFSFTTMEPPDLDPPFVISNSPTEGQTNVPLTTSVLVTFNENITVPQGQGTVSVTPDPPGQFVIEIHDRSIEIVPGDPSHPWLAEDTIYVVTIGGTLTDGAGNPMGPDFTLSFETGYDGPPKVTGMEPPDGSEQVPTSSSLTIHFSRGMNWTSVRQALRINPDVEGTVEISGTSLVFTPDRKFQGGTTYSVVVSAAAKDDKGNGLASPFEATFITKKSGGTEADALSGGMFAVMVLVIIIVLAALLATLFLLSRRGKGGGGEEEPGPEVSGTRPRPQVHGGTEASGPGIPQVPKPTEPDVPKAPPEPSVPPAGPSGGGDEGNMAGWDAPSR